MAIRPDQADDDIRQGRRKRKESAVKGRVKALLSQHGWFDWMPPSNMYGKSGASDFHALKAGVFMAVETKSNGGRLTELQKKFLRSVIAQDGFGFVVDEARLGVFEEFLDRFDRSIRDVAGKKAIMSEDGARMLDGIAAMTRDL